MARAGFFTLIFRKKLLTFYSHFTFFVDFFQKRDYSRQRVRVRVVFIGVPVKKIKKKVKKTVDIFRENGKISVIVNQQQQHNKTKQ